MIKTAVFSDDRIYRYRLDRLWDARLPAMAVIGLNPSTADETEDDPTIRRCIRFAADWGYGGLIMVNLFSYRATDPDEMLTAPNPIGPDCDKHIELAAKEAFFILAAWGANGTHLARDHDVRRLVEPIRQMHCLKKTKHGQPGHPLYIRADTQPILF